jgi:hypothetical protein
MHAVLNGYGAAQQKQLSQCMQEIFDQSSIVLPKRTLRASVH